MITYFSKKKRDLTILLTQILISENNLCLLTTIDRKGLINIWVYHPLLLNTRFKPSSLLERICINE